MLFLLALVQGLALTSGKTVFDFNAVDIYGDNQASLKMILPQLLYFNICHSMFGNYD